MYCKPEENNIDKGNPERINGKIDGEVSKSKSTEKKYKNN